MRLDRYLKKNGALCASLLVINFFLMHGAEQGQDVSYQDYFQNYLVPYFQEPLGSTTEQLRKDVIILCLNTQSDAHRKLLLAFNFFHPAVETLKKSKIQKKKKIKLLNAFVDHGHIGPYEYIDHLCALDYYTKFFQVPKMNDVLLSQLLNWGINPFMHTTDKKKQLLWAERLPTFTRLQWALDDGAEFAIKNIPTTYLHNDSVDFFCSKVSSYGSLRATFLRDQVQVNNQFINDKRFPSLFVLASLAAIRKVFRIDQHKLVVEDSLSSILDWMKLQTNKKLFFSVLFFHPDSIANSVELPYPETKLNLLNRLYRQLTALEYLSYRAIIEFYPHFFITKKMSISALHKILELGADPRLAFDHMAKSKNNIPGILYGCDTGRIDLWVKTIICKSSKNKFLKLKLLLNYLQENTYLDVQRYIAFALAHQKKAVLKYLIKKITLTQGTIDLLENADIALKKKEYKHE